MRNNNKFGDSYIYLVMLNQFLSYAKSGNWDLPSPFGFVFILTMELIESTKRNVVNGISQPCRRLFLGNDSNLRSERNQSIDDGGMNPSKESNMRYIYVPLSKQTVKVEEACRH